MYFYSGKLSYGRHTETDRFIFVNDFGYCKDYSTRILHKAYNRQKLQLTFKYQQ